jgi:hypothetical protein
LRALETWLLETMWDVRPDQDPLAVDLFSWLDHDLIEYGDGEYTEGELRALWEPLALPADVGVAVGDSSAPQVDLAPSYSSGIMPSTLTAA